MLGIYLVFEVYIPERFALHFVMLKLSLKEVNGIAKYNSYVLDLGFVPSTSLTLSAS